MAIYFALTDLWWAVLFKLAHLVHLKTLVLAVALVACQCSPALAQGPGPQDPTDGLVIRSVSVSGIGDRALSPGLRRDIAALANTSLDTATLDSLAARIEAERLNVVVATRRVPTGDGGARVIFLVADKGEHQASDEPGIQENVNARYVIESVAIEGVDEARLSADVRDGLHALVGRALVREDVSQLLTRVRRELDGFEVTRRLSRGTERGRLRLTIQVRPGESLRWLHFQDNRSKFLYHGQQGWSGLFDTTFGGRDLRVAPIVAVSNADDLVEEYSGYGIRLEARNVGHERAGLSLELSTFDVGWMPETLAVLNASGQGASAYGKRSTVAPSVRVALSRQLHVSGGVSITQLSNDDGLDLSRAANAYAFGIGYTARWGSSQGRHSLNVAASTRKGATSLQSDYDYTRYLGTLDYRVRWGHNRVVASAVVGAVEGDAPLFEQLTLGDSRTLRGWDKFAIAPAGGNRAAHGSMEFSHRGLAAFVDVGSVWQSGSRSETRVSTGVGFHTQGFFTTVAFPLNTPDVRGVVMVGVRF